MSDLDAMHYGKTGKNHHGSTQAAETEDTDTITVGDEEMWEQLS